LLATIAVPDWIERVTGLEPDGGSGALEWVIVIVLAGCGACFFVLARREWRRMRSGAALDGL